MRIGGIHGVANYRPGETAGVAAYHLTRAWHRNLRRGPLSTAADACDLAVAYYADLLRTPGRQGGEGGLDDLGPEAADMVRNWLTLFPVPAGTAMGPGTAPLRQCLAWIAARRRLAPRLVELFIARFFAEVATYLHGGARRAVRDEVARHLREHAARVVVAHSLGSVVAYETLWEHPELAIDLLVTLGSPLALPGAVFPRLAPAPRAGSGERPPNVRRWVNLADPGDLIALPPKGISQRFVGVDLDRHDVIHAFDFHTAANYLACGRLAEVLRACVDT